MQVSRVQHIFWHLCTSIVAPSFWGILKFFLTYLNLTDPWPPNLKGAPTHDPLSKIRPLTASIRMILKPPKTKWPLLYTNAHFFRFAREPNFYFFLANTIILPSFSVSANIIFSQFSSLFQIEIFVFNVASIKHCFCCHFVP